jgi:hypothetical protein
MAGPWWVRCEAVSQEVRAFLEEGRFVLKSMI